MDGPVAKDGTPPPFYANRFCPFCHKAWLAIEEAGLAVDYIHVDLGPGKVRLGAEEGPIGVGDLC